MWGQHLGSFTGWQQFLLTLQVRSFELDFRGSVPLPSRILSSSLGTRSSQPHPACSPCLLKDSGLISPEKSSLVNSRRATVVPRFSQSRHSISLIYSTEFIEHLCHGRHCSAAMDTVDQSLPSTLVGETKNKQIKKTPRWSQVSRLWRLRTQAAMGMSWEDPSEGLTSTQKRPGRIPGRTISQVEGQGQGLWDGIYCVPSHFSLRSTVFIDIDVLLPDPFMPCLSFIKSLFCVSCHREGRKSTCN